MTGSSQYVDGTYAGKVHDWHSGDAPWKSAKVLEMLARHRLSPRTVCDVGCGAGRILAEMQRRLPQDTELSGFDISPQAIAMARPHENRRLRYRNEDFLAATTPPFDLLLLLDVFEHVPDYLGFLAALRDRASRFIFHIPLEISLQSHRHDAAEVRGARDRFGHLHQFTKQTALMTLEDTGYEVVDHFYTDDWEGPLTGFSLQRLACMARRLMARARPDLAALIFTRFNLLVRARPAP